MNMTEAEVLKHLKATCDKAGSIKVWSTQNDLSYSYVSSVIRGEKPLSDRVLKAIGIKRVVLYVKKDGMSKKVMKFEDN